MPSAPRRTPPLAFWLVDHARQAEDLCSMVVWNTLHGVATQNTLNLYRREYLKFGAKFLEVL